MATLLNKMNQLLTKIQSIFSTDSDSAWDSYRKSKVLAPIPIRNDEYQKPQVKKTK